MLSYVRGLTTPPPLVFSVMAGASAMTGWLVVVSATARLPAIMLAGRMRASSKLMVAAGRLGVLVC